MNFNNERWSSHEDSQLRRGRRGEKSQFSRIHLNLCFAVSHPPCRLVPYGTMALCPLPCAIRHYITMSLCHSATMPLCQSLCHYVIVPLCRHVTMSLYAICQRSERCQTVWVVISGSRALNLNLKSKKSAAIHSDPLTNKVTPIPTPSQKR